MHLTVLAVFQGRPKDGPEDKFRLNPVVPRLQELLGGAKVSKVDDSIGPEVAGAAKALGNGEVGARLPAQLTLLGT